MIEIILAISIIAIGISSVMALFSTGIKKGREVTVGNDMNNVIESILSQVRRIALMYGEATGWHADFEQAFSAMKKVDGKYVWEKKSEGSDQDKSVGIDTFNDSNDKLKKDSRSFIFDFQNGNLLYRQLEVLACDSNGVPSEYGYGFSAVAEVRKIPEPDNGVIVLTVPGGVEGKALSASGKEEDLMKDADNKDARNLCRRTLMVRISYPADVPMSAREVRIFRLEIFNDKYNRFIQ
jgi:type II secretory pathway pseudopilin PulG